MAGLMGGIEPVSDKIEDLPVANRLGHTLRFLARAASQALRFPLVGFSLETRRPAFRIDRFLSSVIQIPSDTAMCKETLRRGDTYCVTDLRLTEIHASNPLVCNSPYIRGYAGCVLRDIRLLPMGTFCLFDTAPHEMSSQDVYLLRGFARSASDYINAYVDTCQPMPDDMARNFVDNAQFAISVGDRTEAEHLIHLAYEMYDEISGRSQLP